MDELLDEHQVRTRGAAEVDELLDEHQFRTREAVEEHLLRGVVSAAYSQHGAAPPPRYRQDQGERWLRVLAAWMVADNTRDLAWWRLPSAVPRWQFRAARLLATGVPPGLLFALLGNEGRPEPGFVAGVGFGVAGLVFDSLVVHGIQPERGPVARIAVGYGLAGLVTGIFTGLLLVGAPEGVQPGAIAGVGAALASLPLVAAAARRFGADVRPTATSGTPLDPYAYWRQDRRRSAAFGVLLALDVGAAITAACTLAGEPLTRVVLAVALQAVVMPWFVLTLSRRAKTKIASLLLWARRKGPFRLLPFLEEARRLGLLRNGGPVYQFRHARLQDALAADSGDRVRAGGGGRWRGRRRPGR